MVDVLINISTRLDAGHWALIAGGMIVLDAIWNRYSN